MLQGQVTNDLHRCSFGYQEGTGAGGYHAGVGLMMRVPGGGGSSFVPVGAPPSPALGSAGSWSR